MASGMGQPAIGIYSYELFAFYDVKNIIRIGSCGSIDPDLHVRDIIIAQGACTNGNYANQYNLPGTFCPIASFELLEKAVAATRAAGVNFKVGNILSSDMFYDDAQSGMEWSKMGVLGVEMESAALYCNAARLRKNALCICTVSDSFINPSENTTAEERQESFTTMMEIALEIA
jgi:purine-nucleoside phosphorylase